MTRQRLILVAIFWVLFSAQIAFGASIAITPTGNGTFVIQGGSMDGVAGIDLSVLYDSKLLASPTVTQGGLVSGSMMVANTNIPGSIRILVISTKAFSGAGPIVTISFGSHTGTGNLSVSTTMIDSKQAAVVVAGGGKSSTMDFQTSADASGSAGFIQAPGVPFSQPTQNTVTAPPSSTSTATSTSLGTVSMPKETQGKIDTKSVETAAAAEPVLEPAIPAPAETTNNEKQAIEPQKPAEISTVSYKGILEVFRAHQGDKTPAIVIALINSEVAPTIHQEPSVVLSDGKTTVKIKVKLGTDNEKSPNFVLNGAKLVSLKKEAADPEWVVVAMPHSNVLQAGLTILTDNSIIEYPLTLAPPVGKVSAVEADFNAFLKDSGAAAPKHDLNGDGKHDYLDDFLYTANYLVKKGVSGKPE